MNDKAFESYEDVLEEAELDTRIGDHIAVVETLEVDHWKSGDKRYKAKVRLMTANEALADFTMTERKAKDAIKKELASAAPNVRKAIASNLRLHEELHKFYSMTVDDLKAGIKLGVKTVKTKRDPITGKGGFIRVIAFKPLGEVEGKDVAISSVPF